LPVRAILHGLVAHPLFAEAVSPLNVCFEPGQYLCRRLAALERKAGETPHTVDVAESQIHHLLSQTEARSTAGTNEGGPGYQRTMAIGFNFCPIHAEFLIDSPLATLT